MTSTTSVQKPGAEQELTDGQNLPGWPNLTRRKLTDNQLAVVERYLAVWNESDPVARRAAVAGLWAAGATEFLEGVRFSGHRALDARVTEAHQAFVAGGDYTVTSADDATGHGEVVALTIQLARAGGERAGQVDWAARVFLLLGPDGLIRQDYHLTVQPLPGQ